MTARLLSVCLAVILVALALVRVSVTSAGQARCAERGIQKSGQPWQWVGGGVCEITIRDHKQ